MTRQEKPHKREKTLEKLKKISAYIGAAALLGSFIYKPLLNIAVEAGISYLIFDAAKDLTDKKQHVH